MKTICISIFHWNDIVLLKLSRPKPQPSPFSSIVCDGFNLILFITPALYRHLYFPLPSLVDHRVMVGLVFKKSIALIPKS